MSEEKNVPILTKIQSELKAPKGQWNDFGKYHYRSAEDIEEALKPLLLKYGAELKFDENIIEVGGRVYVQEVAMYKDEQQSVQVKGHAREDANKKGMDGSQITGAASSYATKYALSKLFLIDDAKDADSEEPKSTKTKSSAKSTGAGASTKSLPKYTKKQLDDAKVKYNGTKISLKTIYEQAINGSGDEQKKARQWWKYNYERPKTELGNLVFQANTEFKKEK